MDERDFEIMAKTIFGEARGEAQEGQVAVACCILNRFKSGKWFAGKSIADTCQKAWQFSCWNKNDPNRAVLESLTYPTYSKYFPIIEEAQKGDITNGATHYYAPKVVACPKWAKGKTPCAEIGNHLFFKDID